jgi:hypothetical protein
MTEPEWLAATDPAPMLEALQATGKASDRKLRLFAAACCRGLWKLCWDKRTRKAIKTSEEYADGLASKKELDAAGHAAWQAACKTPSGKGPQVERLKSWVWQAVRVAVYEDELMRNAVMGAAVAVAEAGQEIDRETHSTTAGLLREIFVNPFRPLPPLAPSVLTWNNATVVHLAEAIYEDRILPAGTFRPDRLAVLADALEEAGCTETSLLGHLRGPGPHVRGCFAVDAILGQAGPWPWERP